jgi:hypothetical protein
LALSNTVDAEEDTSLNLYPSVEARLTIEHARLQEQKLVKSQNITIWSAQVFQISFYLIFF